jgi:NADPH:quinone reductase-like Zn-dependent oxidoreductase
MRAVALTAFGGVENLQDREIPQPVPQQGEVRIRVHAAAFNPVDYKFRQGRFGGSLPMVLGQDAAGVIDAVGAGVTGLAEGDEVYAFLGGPVSNGAYAEWVCVPAPFVARKPKSLSFEEAAAVPLAGLTAYHAVMTPTVLRGGKSAFVAGGAGGVGSMAIQLLRLSGADPILTTAGSEASVEFLVNKLHVPPEHILRYRGLSVTQLIEAVLKMNGGRRLGATFDFWGGDMKRLCCAVLDFEGRAVSIVEEPPDFALNVWNARHSPLFTHSATLHCCFMGARAIFGGPETWSVYREQLAELRDLFEAGKLRCAACVNVGELSAETARRGHAILENRQAQGKLIMTVPE